MKWSREASLYTLLVIDTAFFFVEIIAGYTVGSLALVADSFHMLNDVVSLLVALYAIKVASNESSNEYTFGWQRAEVLGALVNGVFLLALCFSIFLEAIQRFFGAPEVGHPKLVVIVGSLGLLSNIVGLFLFHDHGHAHGHSHGHSHGPAHSNPTSSASQAEQGRVAPGYGAISATANQSEPEYPEEVNDTFDELYMHPSAQRAALVRSVQSLPCGRRRAASNSSVHNAFGHSKTNSAQLAPNDTASDSEAVRATAHTPLLSGQDGSHSQAHGHEHEEHAGHDHGHGHGHSHGGEDGSMNAKGVFLHVLGDALGNVGVIATGLFIWLTNYSWRFYFDPAISFLITCIIFSSALPLVRSASVILLQGTPAAIPLDQVRTAILRVEGIEDVHELHVWSLSESKVVGSVHVLVKSSAEWLSASAEIREILHSFGIHSSTIQPEMLAELKAVAASSERSGAAISERDFDAAAQNNACLVSCVSACVDPKCCDNGQQQQQQESQPSGQA